MKTFATCSCAALAALLSAATARAADPPPPADVLGKLHHSNQKEVEMGRLAEQKGQSKEVKDFGKMLVKDHTAADKKVTALAKKEKVDLAATTPPVKGDDDVEKASGADFDKKFAKAMLDDHKKDVSEVSAARDSTNDPKLKGLLNELVPTLEKHQQTAQRIVDAQK